MLLHLPFYGEVALIKRIKNALKAVVSTNKIYIGDVPW